jgi:hypothetical protein
MVERRALFATSIFSRVEDTADDSLEHNDWLVSVPVLLTDMEYTIVTYWEEKKVEIFHYQL